MKSKSNIRLHLGCGQKYLEGYLNIDFPSTEHTVQDTSVADEFHNLYELRYQQHSIKEVRLHHVFEHFDRVSACALLASWNSWLPQGGVVHIEVPDFETTFRKNLGMFSNPKHEGVGLRHIFGSQEASWAIHYEGYSKRRMRKLLQTFGFGMFYCNQYAYKRTFNLEVKASKLKELTRQEAEARAGLYLQDYLVDSSESEQRMMQVWLGNFRTQLEKTFAGSE